MLTLKERGTAGVSTRNMTLTAMLTALLCITGPVTLPLGPIPLSLTTGVLMLMALLLGARRACLCCGVYLLIGLLGLPVFSGFTGGGGALLGPTGGFLLGYLPMTALCGWVCARTERRLLRAAGMIAANLLLILVGTMWYCRQAGVSFAAGLMVCALPFLPGDGLKIAAVLLGGSAVRNRLSKAKLLK